MSNLGFTYSSNQFKITDVSGTDLSSDNPGWVTLPSTTAGQMVTLKTTDATHLFDDAGAATSDIAGEEFGVTSGRAWGNSRPFFLYAVNADDTDANMAFAISPNPAASNSPTSNYIGYHGNPATNTDDKNFFFLTSSNVTATHDDKPCVCIGSFTMTMDAADDWTVDTLDDEWDGLGRFQEGRWFDMPTGQMGAVSGEFFDSSDAPTWATYSSIVFKYKLNRDGRVNIHFTTTNAGNCTNGISGGATKLVLPYAFYSGSSASTYIVVGVVRYGGARDVSLGTMGPGNSEIGLYNSAGTPYAMNGFSSNSDDIEIWFDYYMRTTT